MTLQKEIDNARKDIHTDSYAMSIGEIVNLYRDGELDVHPEFQRFFRWTDDQKTNLIESILLGIPLPSIFVFQRKDGVWDIIDGVQRISTILQLMGELKNEKSEVVRPLELSAAKYLPSLDGKFWQKWEKHKIDDKITSEQIFTKDQQLLIKRAKIDFKIVLRESDQDAKYELFQRLNRGGTALSDQEVRNCILVMLNKEFFEFVVELASSQSFLDCCALSDPAINERYDMELVLRFLIFRSIDLGKLKEIRDLGEFITSEATEMAKTKQLSFSRERKRFNETFKRLSSALSSDSFRRFAKVEKRFKGGFSVSAFEVIAFGLASDKSRLNSLTDSEIRKTVESLWAQPEFVDASRSGTRAAARIPKTLTIGRKLFS
jgi:hypothetical protein